MRTTISAAVCLALASVAIADNADAAIRKHTSISAQSLEPALREFAKARDLQLIFVAEDLHGRNTKGAVGELTHIEALNEILSGTGLMFIEIDEQTISILPKTMALDQARNGARNSVSESRGSRHEEPVEQAGFTRTRLAQSSESAPVREVTASAKSDASLPARKELEEVVVTGSHIRGAQNHSSPVITFDREAIEASGYATTQELIQSLPQNLASISDTTVGGWNGGPPSGVYASYDGSGVNLRGLGGGATLVLLNGRRIAAAGDGSFVDLSLIPLGAIERVDVLTDGASALYGSDAVGGVVNLVLRKDFQGAETRVSYGAVTEGSLDEFQIGQMFGHSWESGHALVSYEYFERSDLPAYERSFVDTKGPFGDLVLIPGQERHGGLAVIEQRLSDRITLASDVFFGRRASESGYVSGGISVTQSTQSSQRGATLGLKMDMAHDWQARLTGLYDKNDSELTFAYDGGALQAGNEMRLMAMDLAMDGSVAATPGGNVRLAVGAHARKEDFAQVDLSYPVELKRDLTAAYAEVLVPWVSEQNRRPGIERLELNVAARYESYSDFGSTFNPKIGLAWAPIAGLNLRGTWGTSFKAPLLTQLNAGLSYTNLYLDYFRTPSGMASGVYLEGNGPNLKPEESSNWTVGFDFSPPSLPELSLSTTYFTIDYDDRITRPFPTGFSSDEVLMFPMYDGIAVMRDPDRSYVDQLFASAVITSCQDLASRTTCDFTDDNLNQVIAVVDGRLRNLAGTHMSGVDFSASYRLPSSIGEWGVSLSGSYLLENRQQLVPTAPETNEMNKVWNPVDLRLRNSVSFSRNGLNAIATVNYLDNYRDTRSQAWLGATPRTRVASWTTLDLTVEYDLGRLWSLTEDGASSLRVSAFNLLDRDPPFVASSMGLYYDGANASPRGRFVSAQFTVRW